MKGGLKSFSEQNGSKNGKQQVPILKHIFDKHPKHWTVLLLPSLKLPPKAGCAQRGNFHWVVTPQQAQT